MSLFNKIFGDPNTATIKSLQPIVDIINAKEDQIQSLSDIALASKTSEFKNRLKDGASLNDILPECFAVVRETALRVLGERHYDVQLIGGAVIHQGKIAEMRTGEGKTLVSTLPIYLNALTGSGVHVVTVNDYLARRDTVWMGQIFNFLGLSVGVINQEASYLYDSGHTDDDSVDAERDAKRDTVGSFKIVYDFLRPCSRQESYSADITYGTNSEFGFDYLRDNTALDASQLRQKGHAFAIIDEIDSILIDEARTPLIISMPSNESEDLYTKFAGIAGSLNIDEHFTVDEKFKTVQLNDEGIGKAEKMLGVDNIYTDRGIKYVHHLETAVRAKALYKKDKEYVVRNNEVIIVDEFTGRLQPGRRWSEGLHQAIEAKEGVSIQRETRTAASITYQNYFKQYKKLSGMTGTAITSAEEFLKVYGLDVVSVPTHRPLARRDLNDLIFQTENGKLKALAKFVKTINETGQPVLIGTASIEKNEVVSAFLTKNGISHEILNAKNHEREGEIIAQAGVKGRVTVATNMAGRGVDIKLGGSPSTKEQHKEVKDLGGLYVIGTERHEARRIDNQLRGRSGRQGDAGTSQFYVSLDDNLMRVFASDAIKRMMGKFGIEEDYPIENSLITRSLETAQTKIEGLHFDSRKHVLEYDDVLSHQRESVYERRRNMLVGSDARVLDELDISIGDNKDVKAVAMDLRQKLGDEEFFSIIRRLILQSTDVLWMDHLEQMDYMRSSVNLRAYGQRDPLVEYKKEGLHLFKEMQIAVDDQIKKMLPNIKEGIAEGALAREQQEMQRMRAQMQLMGGSNTTISANRAPIGNVSADLNTNTMSNSRDSQKNIHAHGQKTKVPGRNDPCHCGSGKKYKKCHLHVD